MTSSVLDHIKPNVIIKPGLQVKKISFLKQLLLFENFIDFFSNNRGYLRILVVFSQTTTVIREFPVVFLKQHML